MGTPRSRSRSPTHAARGASPTRGADAPVSVTDIDPEAVRAALREFVQNLATAERDRVSETCPGFTQLWGLHHGHEMLWFGVTQTNSVVDGLVILAQPGFTL